MSFLEHLDELRKRIVNSAIAIARLRRRSASTCINQIVDFILAPTRKALPPGVKLIYTQPGEAFSLYVQIALIMGVVLAAPFIMYQVWMFIAPGLYSNEKRLAIPFVLFTTIGFLLGAAFNHYIAFPFMMAFFASFNTPDLAFMPKLDDVFGSIRRCCSAWASSSRCPPSCFFLAKMKMVTARFLLKHFKCAFLIIFIAAAVITPTGDDDDAGDLRRPDGRALRPEHRHRVGGRPQAPEGDRGRLIGQAPPSATMGPGEHQGVLFPTDCLARRGPRRGERRHARGRDRPADGDGTARRGTARRAGRVEAPRVRRARRRCARSKRSAIHER